MTHLMIALFLTISATSSSEEEDAINTTSIPEEHLTRQKDQVPFIEFENDPKVQISEDKATYAMKTGNRTIEVSCEVQNTDFRSQYHTKWDKLKKKTSPEDQNENQHNPTASVSLSWTWD
ncbi:MAG: hypothetical protein JSS30_05270 [Verrucomicrobia bacterium]|nr:hypothetical protein [Verrucomicrobiota bacterium]